VEDNRIIFGGWTTADREDAAQMAVGIRLLIPISLLRADRG